MILMAETFSREFLEINCGLEWVGDDVLKGRAEERC
jgi:hypothetical protein